MVSLTSRFAALGRAPRAHAGPGESSSPRLPWPLPIAPTLLIAGVITYGWWRAVHQQLVPMPGVPGDPRTAATLATLARLAGNGLEAAFYVLSWRAFGHRIPFVRLYAWITLLSGADLFAFEMRQHFLDTRGAVPVAAAIVSGIGGLPGSWLPRAFHVAFASTGLLTLARIAFTARAQTLATGVALGRTLAFTGATWLLTHLVLGFGYALLQGRSVPGLP